MTFSEVIRVQDGMVQNLPLHRARMERTVGHPIELKIDPPRTCGRVKCRVVYDAEGVRSVEFAPYIIRRIEKVAIVHDDEINYALKSTDRRRLNELRGKYDDVIIIKNGLVTDSSFANIVIEKGGLFTSSTPLLRGTKREQLLREGVITEREVREEDLQTAARIHFINAMIDLNECTIKL